MMLYIELQSTSPAPQWLTPKRAVLPPRLHVHPLLAGDDIEEEQQWLRRSGDRLEPAGSDSMQRRVFVCASTPNATTSGLPGKKAAIELAMG